MQPSFRVAFGRLFVVRLLGTVSLRFAYPFLPTIADGLDTDLAAVGVGVACGEAAGFLAPFLGRRLDLAGRRTSMVAGLVVSAVGCAAVAASPNVVAFGAGMLVLAVGRFAYDISFNAWVGDEVTFERRGRATGIGELAWSGSFVFGVPLFGLVTSLSSWRVPYLLSALILLASVPVVLATLAPREPRPHDPDAVPAPRFARPTALHLAVVGTSLGAALFFVTEGAWFEDDLGMTERTISAVVIVLGIGEIIGSLLSAVLADRIGKRPSMALGLVVLVPAAVGFSLVGQLDAAAVAVAFLVGLGFELAFVSAIPLVVEVGEDRRAGAMSMLVAALTGARTVAAVVGTRLYESFGIDAVVAVSVPVLVLALAVVILRVHEPGRPTPATLTP